MKSIIGFILFPVAILLFGCVFIIGFPFEIAYCFYHSHIGNAVGYLNKRLRSMAYSLDVCANAMFPGLWTWMFINPDQTTYYDEDFQGYEKLDTVAPEHYHFGKPGQPLSYVLGKNQIIGRLSKGGWNVVKDLKLITKSEHCLDAVIDYESKD